MDSRDSLAMSLYAQLFKWIVQKLNQSLKGADSFHSIGVLDIFGFENFTVCCRCLCVILLILLIFPPSFISSIKRDLIFTGR